MPDECVRVRVEDGVGWLELDRPPLNTFDWTLHRGMSDALCQLLDDPSVRVVVFASALERYYSVGGDLRFFQSLTPDGMRQYVLAWRDFTLMMRRSSKPLLAAIHGTAAGGGVEVALLCDIRFAAADARLGLTEIATGFCPQLGTTRTLARILGRSRALRFLYAGELISAGEAADLGLVDVVSDPDQLHAEVQSYAADLARKPAAALAAIRRCVTEGLEHNDDDFFAIELEEAVHLATTPDFKEGIQAFVEKRPPRWQR